MCWSESEKQLERVTHKTQSALKDKLAALMKQETMSGKLDEHHLNAGDEQLPWAWQGPSQRYLQFSREQAP